jgi:hypothetical protein
MSLPCPYYGLGTVSNLSVNDVKGYYIRFIKYFLENYLQGTGLYSDLTGLILSYLVLKIEKVFIDIIPKIYTPKIYSNCSNHWINYLLSPSSPNHSSLASYSSSYSPSYSSVSSGPVKYLTSLEVDKYYNELIEYFIKYYLQGTKLDSDATRLILSYLDPKTERVFIDTILKIYTPTVISKSPNHWITNHDYYNVFMILLYKIDLHTVFWVRKSEEPYITKEGKVLFFNENTYIDKGKFCFTLCTSKHKYHILQMNAFFSTEKFFKCLLRSGFSREVARTFISSVTNPISDYMTVKIQ